MIGILLNIRKTSEHNVVLLNELVELVKDQNDLRLQINVTAGLDRIFECVTDIQACKNVKVTISSSKVDYTNAELRGRYGELNCDYVWFIDDDFRITDIEHTRFTLRECEDYMTSHPTCQIIRFAFNSEKKSIIKFSFPITSTSLSCGLFIRVKPHPVFKPKQLSWHWKTDDFTMVLNALEKGYGVELHNHAVIHNIKSRPDEVRFTYDQIHEALELNSPYDLARDSDGNYFYVVPENATGELTTAPSVRDILIKKLHKVNGTPINKHGGRIRIVSTSPCSIIRDNENLFPSNKFSLRYITRSSSYTGEKYLNNEILIREAIQGCDILILSAGTLGKEYDLLKGGSIETLPTLDWNLKYLNMFLKTHEFSGIVIFMGSVASYRGYPTHPAYAAEKAYFKTIMKSLSIGSENYPDLRFHHLEIPSTISRMCNHGADSRCIAEHIYMLCNLDNQSENMIVHEAEVVR